MPLQEIPIIERQVSIQSNQTPDFQSSTQELAASQNNLSAIGSQVAQSVSNQIATQLGYQSGKNPHGDLIPPITEFDKNFADSYHAQAAATLSTEGQKLLEDAHVEMSKPNRLTPQLINNTHEQLQLGLNKIAEHAPTAIKTQLQKSFDSQLLNQMTTYRTRMVEQQREDQKNSLQNGIDIQIQNALEFSKNGDLKGANNAVEVVKKMADNAVINNFITPEQARIAKETAIQTSLNGQYINQAMDALKQGKYPEFEKKYSEKKPANMTNEQWLTTGRAMAEQVNFIQSLRSQDENLQSQKMLNLIATKPGDITGTQWQEFANNVSPLKAEQVRFHYIQALKVSQSNNIETNNLLSNFSNPEAWANSNEKTQNAAFYKNVNYTIQQNEKNGTPITQDQAEVQVAASAGGKVSVFINTLKNKLHSGNPAFIESAAEQIHNLISIKAYHALSGLTDEDKALYTSYESLRDSRDPITAARDSHNIVLDVDKDPIKQKWSNFISDKTKGGISHIDFALSQFGLNQQSFINLSMANVYGNDILNKYRSFYILLNGDTNNARKLTQQHIDQNYGKTGINGGSYTTLHPLEKIVGFTDTSGTPYIQQDIINQINKKFLIIKEAYNSPAIPYDRNHSYMKHQSDEYWETIPLSVNKHGIFSTTFDPIKVKRHIRTKNGIQTDTFNLVLQGNAFDNWDVNIQTNDGMRNIFEIAPYLGVISYIPNIKAIKDSFNKDHPLK